MSDIPKNKKDSAPEIEENMLISWFESKFGYLKPYYNTIAVVAGLLLVGGVLGAILWKAQSDSYAEQWNALNLAITEYNNSGSTEHLTDMAADVEGTPASLWALQYAGDQKLDTGLTKLANPIRYPDENQEDLRDAAFRDIRSAKDIYQQILESQAKRSSLLEQRTVFSLARASETLGEWEDAKKFYTQLVENMPDSEFAGMAQKGLERASDEKAVAFLEQFKATEFVVAPGVELDGEVPEIDFPDVEVPEPPADEEAEESDQAAAPEVGSEEMKEESKSESTTDEKSEENAEEKKEDSKEDDAVKAEETKKDETKADSVKEDETKEESKSEAKTEENSKDDNKSEESEKKSDDTKSDKTEKKKDE